MILDLSLVPAGYVLRNIRFNETGTLTINMFRGQTFATGTGPTLEAAIQNALATNSQVLDVDTLKHDLSAVGLLVIDLDP